MEKAVITLKFPENHPKKPVTPFSTEARIAPDEKSDLTPLRRISDATLTALNGEHYPAKKPEEVFP